MWWKKNKWKVIIPVLAVIVLGAAFWFGGNAPGLQGFKPAVPSPDATVAVEGRPDALNGTLSGDEKAALAAELAGGDAPVMQGSESYSAQHGMELDPSTGKDKYGTDPVPEGKPLPVEPQDAAISDVEHKCTISISCSTINDNIGWLDPEKVELVPEDGWILRPVEVTFYEGESVFNILARTCKQNGIHLEFQNTPMYNSAYIEGINNLYEFDCGNISGWMYSVNGESASVGCGSYRLKDGDVIIWEYTLTGVGE